MKKLDWKAFGQFLSVLLNLFTLIRETFSEMGIGIEIVPYALDVGKESFVERLRSMGEEFNAAQRWRLIDENTLLVNLEAPLLIPSEKAKGNNASGAGWIKVEKRGDDVFVDGRKVILYQQNAANCDQVVLELRKKETLHPNILDAWLENQNFIPSEWQRLSQFAPCVWFWAVTFSNENHTSFGTTGNNYLPRGMQYANGKWKHVFMWRDFGVGGPALVLEVPSVQTEAERSPLTQ